MCYWRNLQLVRNPRSKELARSSAEVECQALAQVAAEITWLINFLQELWVSNLKPIVLHSTLHITQNSIFHECTKHIEIDCHFIGDKVMEGLIQLSYLPTHSQLANVLTKVLPSQQHWTLLYKLGMLPNHPKLEGGC